MADFIPKTPPIWQTQLAFELDPADVTATIATELLIGGGSLSGLVCVSVDIGQPNPEYIIGNLSGNTLTITLRNVDPLDPTVSLGTFGSIHRQGAVVKITDFATIQILRNLLNGNQPLQNTISYNSAKTPVNPQDVVDKGYVDSISVAGAPDASTTAKGLSRLTASPNVTLGNPTITIASPAVVTLASHGLTVNDTVQFTTSGSLPTGLSPSTNYFVISTGLTANTFEISATIGGSAINTSGSQSGTHTLIKTTPISIGANDYRLNPNNYAASAVGTDAYAITLGNAPSAYVTGQVFWFLADVANTGACTLNVNGLGAKNLKVNGNLAPQDNYIKAAQIIGVIYDGTNLQIFSVSGKPSVSQTGEEIYGVPNGGTDTYAITVAPAPTAYVAGMVFRFKADVANAGAATLNVNSLGAVAIVKNFNTVLSDNDIIAGQLVEVEYDGTNFQMLSPIANVVAYKNGTTTKNSTDSSTTQNIPHGLGRIPKFIKITATLAVQYPTGGGIHGFFTATAITTYNGTTQSSVSVITGNDGAGNTGSNLTTFSLNNGGTVGDTQNGVITFDGTNIIITWTKTGSPSGTYNLLWEAQA